MILMTIFSIVLILVMIMMTMIIGMDNNIHHNLNSDYDIWDDHDDHIHHGILILVKTLGMIMMTICIIVFILFMIQGKVMMTMIIMMTIRIILFILVMSQGMIMVTILIFSSKSLSWFWFGDDHDDYDYHDVHSDHDDHIHHIGYEPTLMWSLRSRTPSILLGLTPSLCTDIDTARRWSPQVMSPGVIICIFILVILRMFMMTIVITDTIFIIFIIFFILFMSQGMIICIWRFIKLNLHIFKPTHKAGLL